MLSDKEAVVNYMIWFKSIFFCIMKRKTRRACWLEIHIHDANFHKKAHFEMPHLNASCGFDFKIPNETDDCNFRQKKKKKLKTVLVLLGFISFLSLPC